MNSHSRLPQVSYYQVEQIFRAINEVAAKIKGSQNVDDYARQEIATVQQNIATLQNQMVGVAQFDDSVDQKLLAPLRTYFYNNLGEFIADVENDFATQAAAINTATTAMSNGLISVSNRLTTNENSITQLNTDLALYTPLTQFTAFTNSVSSIQVALAAQQISAYFGPVYRFKITNAPVGAGFVQNTLNYTASNQIQILAFNGDITQYNLSEWAYTPGTIVVKATDNWQIDTTNIQQLIQANSTLLDTFGWTTVTYNNHVKYWVKGRVNLSFQSSGATGKLGIIIGAVDSSSVNLSEVTLESNQIARHDFTVMNPGENNASVEFILPLSLIPKRWRIAVGVKAQTLGQYSILSTSCLELEVFLRYAF